MLSLEEVVERTLESVPFLGGENVKLETALGRFAEVDLKAKELMRKVTIKRAIVLSL